MLEILEPSNSCLIRKSSYPIQEWLQGAEPMAGLAAETLNCPKEAVLEPRKAVKIKKKQHELNDALTSYKAHVRVVPPC